MLENKDIKKITIFIGHFLPGFKAGGPVTTISNLVEAYGDSASFQIVCGNKDLGDKFPYSGIEQNKWIMKEKYNVYYCDINKLSKKTIIDLTIDSDVVYCCGTYDKYAIKLLQLNKKGKIRKIYLASMGNFSPLALKIKSFKKKMFFFFAKIIHLFDNVIWSFTTYDEYENARPILKSKHLKYSIIQDLPKPPANVCPHQKKNPIKIVFLSRICEMKNLLSLIKALSGCKENITFHIYGSIEDRKYWEKCLNLLSELPENVTWEYKGMVSPANIYKTLCDYDLFILLSKGENFGHVIYESLVCGCVPIISDKTPWNFKQFGRIINLDNYDDISAIIDYYSKMNGIEFCKEQTLAVEYSKAFYLETIKDNCFFKEIIKNEEN